MPFLPFENCFEDYLHLCQTTSGKVATARTHTRHGQDFLLHRSTEDWDISKWYNMFYADLFAFVRPSTSFLRSTGAITFGVFEEKISDQPVRDYFDAQLGLSCHVIPKEPLPLDWKIGKLDTICVQSGVWPLLFVAAVVCSLPS